MKQIYNQIFRIGLILFIISLLLISCSELKNDNNNNLCLVFAYQDRIADAVSIIAVEKEFFKQQGLKIEPYIFSSGPACAEALLYGKAQMATMGDATGIVLVSKIENTYKGGEKIL